MKGLSSVTKRLLPNWLKSYMEYTRNLEAPDTYHFWAGVATIAGALRGKVWVDMDFFKWKPNFFIIYVARPGIVNKSTTIGVGEELLREVEGIHFGPNSVTWQSLTDSFASATERFDLPGSADTIEVSCLTVTASELGTFFDPRNREMVDMLVDLWDGRSVPWKRSTRGSGSVSIPSPWLNLVGATTPAWLRENFPEYAIGGGFTSRTVFIFADHKRQFIAYPGAHKAEGDKQLKLALIKDLQQIASLCGPFNITPEAEEWGTAWYEKHWTTKPSSVQLEGYWARKQTHIHKLAMVLSAAETSSLELSKANLEQALVLMNALELDMNKVFSNVSDNPYAKNAAAIVSALKMKGACTKKTLFQQVFTQMGWLDFEHALTAVTNAGMLDIRQKGTEVIVTLKEIPKEEPPQ